MTGLFSGPCYYIRTVGGEVAAGITAILMWCPAMSTILTQRIFYGSKKIPGFHKSNYQDILLGLSLPAVYLTISYLIYWCVFENTYIVSSDTNSIPIWVLLLYHH